jgi:hypothetical protein
MPPRKRAASAPKTEEPDEQTVEAPAEAEAGGGDEAAAEAPVESVAEESAQPDESDGEQTRSDVQTGGEPCGYCFPGGWAAKADTVGALGCEHGTWQRDPVN